MCCVYIIYATSRQFVRVIASLYVVDSWGHNMSLLVIYTLLPDVRHTECKQLQLF